jgi:hypothetical protein
MRMNPAKFIVLLNTPLLKNLEDCITNVTADSQMFSFKSSNNFKSEAKSYKKFFSAGYAKLKKERFFFLSVECKTVTTEFWNLPTSRLVPQTIIKIMRFFLLTNFLLLGT